MRSLIMGMMTRRVVLLAALGGCAVGEARPAPTVTVEIAGVSLGDDCAPPPPRPTKVAIPARRAPPASPAVHAADVSGNGSRRSGCDQTSMQLAFKASAQAKRTTIKIKKVELLDAKRKYLQTLTPRSPTKWTADGTYAAWDQQLAPGDATSAMYELTAPNWDRLTGGRWSAHSKTFLLRVTVTIGAGTRTVETQAITPARLAPPVPT